MANLTLTIEDHVLRRARIRALEQGTSVNAMVREYLEQLTGDDSAQQAVNEFLAFARSRPETDDPTGSRTWTRAELYDE